MTNHFWKGRSQGHVTHLNFEVSTHIYETAEAKMVKFCVGVSYIKS